MFRILTVLMLFISSTPLIGASVLGRMDLTWPDLDDAPGATLETQIHGSITTMSDNIPSRMSEHTAIADATTVNITHKFGLSNTDLKILFYTGVGDSKVAADPEVLGYTIADNGGDAKNIIDITTPAAGGPHTFSVSISWTGEKATIGGSTNTKDFILGQDISKGAFVKVYDDTSVAKIKPVLEAFSRTAALDSSNAAGTPFDVAVGYAGTVGSYLVTYRRSATSNHLYGVVAQYNAGSPTFGSESVIDAAASFYTCTTYNKTNNNIVVAYETAATLSFKLVTVSGTTITVEDTGSIAIDVKDEMDCEYNSGLGVVVIAVQDDADLYRLKFLGVDSASNTLTVGTATSVNATWMDAVSIVYSSTYDSVLMAGRGNGGASLEYYLYRMTALNSHSLLDSDTTSVKNVFFTGLAEDKTGGGIFNSFKSFTDSNNLLTRAVDVSSDLIVLGTTSVLSTTSPTWNPRPVYNSQLGKVVVTYVDTAGNRVSNTAAATTTTITMGSSTTNTINFNSDSQSSSAIDKMSVFCAKDLTTAANIVCDFRGGDNVFDSTDNIGLFISPNSTVGQVGTVLLYGGVTKEITGTIGAPIYIDTDTGIYTETAQTTPKVGVFLDSGQLNTFKADEDTLDLATSNTPGLTTAEFDSGWLDLPALVWNGTPPTSLTRAKYKWVQTGKRVEVTWEVLYGSAGTSNGSVYWVFPSNMPFPSTSYGAATSTYLAYMGTCSFSTTASSAGIDGRTQFWYPSVGAFRAYCFPDSTLSTAVVRATISYLID